MNKTILPYPTGSKSTGTTRLRLETPEKYPLLPHNGLAPPAVVNFMHGTPKKNPEKIEDFSGQDPNTCNMFTNYKPYSTSIILSNSVRANCLSTL
jgi:hypothetical protein